MESTHVLTSAEQGWEDDGRPKPPDLTDYMYKLKHHPSILGSWCRRYWVVSKRKEQVEYYNDEHAFKNGDRPSRFIPIRSIKTVRGIGEWYIQLIATNETHQEVVYNIKTETTDIQSKWVGELTRYFKELVDWEVELLRTTPRPIPVPEKLGAYLKKLKHKHSNVGSWTKRYFRIDPEQCTLAYYSR